VSSLRPLLPAQKFFRHLRASFIVSFAPFGQANLMEHRGRPDDIGIHSFGTGNPFRIACDKLHMMLEVMVVVEAATEFSSMLLDTGTEFLRG
jgi:hypothetical protein